VADCPNCKFKIDENSGVCPFCAFVLPKKTQDITLVGTPLGGGPSAGAPVPNIEIISDVPDPAAQSPRAVTVDSVAAPKNSGGLLWLVAAAAVGYGAYYHLLPMLNKPAPAVQAPVKPEASLPIPAPKPAEVPAPEPPPPVEKPPEAKAPAAPLSPWDFEGRVYDLVTLEPIAGVEMTFLSDENTVATKTNKDGRFKIKLPPMREGYKLVTDHPDYAEEYFDESVAAYRKMPVGKRLLLRNVNPKHPAWITTEGAPLSRDVALFPLSPDQ
jgi:hypothetical protein